MIATGTESISKLNSFINKECEGGSKIVHIVISLYNYNYQSKFSTGKLAVYSLIIVNSDN